MASGPGLGHGIAAGPVRRTQISQGYLLDSGKLKDFAPGEGGAAGAFAERFDSGGWIEVRIPGDVHRALMATSRIEDPSFLCGHQGSKDLRRTPVRPEATVTSGGDHELQVHLRAPGGYAYFVHLSVPDEATRFGDNYFDLEPGEGRTIAVTNPGRTLAPNMLRISWC